LTGHTLFISDLHLDDCRPAATAALLAFLSGPARQADALYILGDLFEFWLGDDAPTQVGEQVAEALYALSVRGVPCRFIHGNRDFLIGPDYAGESGLDLLAEETVIDLYGRRTLLTHGDQYCTDDHAYQKVRRMLRDPAWQRKFLEKSPSERISFARDARSQSEQYKQGVSEDIMDVNPAAVAAAFKRHGVDRMIHGHTHRPAIHDLQLPQGPAQRVVLGDWYAQGSVLTADSTGLRLQSLAF